MSENVNPIENGPKVHNPFHEVYFLCHRIWTLVENVLCVDQFLM